MTLSPDTACPGEAFASWVDRYADRLYWHVRRLVVVHEDAEDAVQECFVRAYERLGAFRGGEEEVRAWLYRIATRTALDCLRRRRRRLFTPLDAVSRELAERVGSESLFDADRALVRLQQEILRLPLAQRLVFNLRYYDELPYDEIARITGRSAGSLRTNYHLAVETLKKRLAP